MKDERKPLSYWLNKAIPSMRGTYKIIRTTLDDGTIDKDYFLAIEENDEGEILWQSKKMHISEVPYNVSYIEKNQHILRALYY